MACIEHYVNDAENIFSEILQRHYRAQANVYVEYKAARTIQRWFRGYMTRKHIKYLHACATTVQKYWRGYVDRKYYRRLLQNSVHKLLLEHYNLMATKIQKVWRGHYVRAHVFSYYKLKEYINNILKTNREAHERSEAYRTYTEAVMQKEMEKECREWLQYLSFKVHHLIRTHQIEGIYSNHGTHEYSDIEHRLKNIKFTEYMDMKRDAEKRKPYLKHKHNHIFKGRMRECEEVWLHRNDPGKYGLGTGEYGLDTKEYIRNQIDKENLLRIQERPMNFGPINYNDAEAFLGYKKYKCPPLHCPVKNDQEHVESYVVTVSDGVANKSNRPSNASILSSAVSITTIKSSSPSTMSHEIVIEHPDECLESDNGSFKYCSSCMKLLNVPTSKIINTPSYDSALSNKRMSLPLNGYRDSNSGSLGTLSLCRDCKTLSSTRGVSRSSDVFTGLKAARSVSCLATTDISQISNSSSSTPSQPSVE